MNKLRKTFFRSVLALVLCFSMLVGTTFAWFTDTVSSKRNVIATGKLDVELEYYNGTDWSSVEEDTVLFDQNALWEPGYTDVVYLKVSNAGSLALKYQLGVTILREIKSENKNGDELKLSDHIKFGVVEGVNTPYATRDLARAAVTQSEKLSAGYSKIGTISAGEEPQYMALVVYMPEETGSEANYAVGAAVPEIELGIGLAATQLDSEADSFGTEYDSQFPFPNIKFNNTVTANISVDANGTLADSVSLVSEDEGVSAHVPEGVLMEEGATSLTFTIRDVKDSEAEITLDDGENTRSVDVHIEGIAENNTVPILVTVKQMMPVGLNIGNYKFYHVENGETNLMALVDEPTNHNEFNYDPATGDVTMALKSFSEIAMVADTENAWNGTVATTFAAGSGTEKDPYVIANADQLALLGDKVSNDNANYGSAYYKLIVDVNIGGHENYEEKGVIWYPIGYNKVGGEVEAANLDEIYFTPISSAKPGDKDGDVLEKAADNSWYTYGGSFKGVFDGTGHKVTGIYQNTWAMKGDYNGNYYNDAMGLFGYVNGGTIKNLTIDNFYSEGEFAPTGCVTAYAGGNATFENIAITNSHPQTYNTGVAGIVGWDNGSSDLKFKNITVDDTNTISALWGSWDVAASGILGSLKESSKASFDNCHVAATIDVYNDVCGNYQYYWYRYSGAFIGTVYKRQDNGKGALDLSDVTATNCSVNFGDRHEYYYCEFEKNTQASYTEDYQFSRVPHSELNMGANPVTCTHNHTVNEDKQAVYIPYRQLFGGYGWGVDGIDVDEYKNIDITTNSASVLKFANIAKDEYTTNTTVAIGELFAAIGSSIDADNVQVFVSPVGADSTAGAIYTPNTEDWTQGTLTFSGLGDATITISDYYFCVPTTVTVAVVEPQTVEKFEIKDNSAVIYNDYTEKMYTLGDFLGEKTDVEVKKENISISVEGKGVTYVANVEDWTQGTLKFAELADVTITITDNYYCVPTTVTIEVVEPDSVEKFVSADIKEVEIYDICTDNKTYVLGDFFVAKTDMKIVTNAISVEVEGEGVTFTANAEDWTQGTLKFAELADVTITITDNYYCVPTTITVEVKEPETVEKFEVVKGNDQILLDADFKEFKLGDFFVAKTDMKIVTNAISVEVEGEGATFTANADDWTQSIIKFEQPGKVTIAITDGCHCTPTTKEVVVKEPKIVHKFKTKFENNYIYRVGNQNTVALGSLFEAVENVNINANDLLVTVDGNGEGFESNTSDWTKGTIQFRGTGIVEVSITDNNYCDPTMLKLEVVDAMNATSATSATKNNVVLLNDAGLHTIEVSGGYTLYGNGFKLTAENDIMYDAMGAGFVVLRNGTLDNVQIICPNFSHAIVYNSNIHESANDAKPSDSSNNARGNVRSAVMADGNSKIVNSYVHGGRAAIFLRSGNLLVDGSTISGGAAANIHTMSAQSLTLRNATLIQKPFKANVNDTSKTLMGFSGLFECDENGKSTPLKLEGTLVQDAWINESYKQYAPSAASSIITVALDKKEYLHDLDGDGKKESLNLGFTYIPQDSGGSTQADVTDNRINKKAVLYESVDVGNAFASAKVYSYKNTNGTSNDFKVDDEFTYESSSQGTTAPVVNFTDTNADRVFETKFDASDNRWESTLTVNLDNDNYVFSFDKLLAQKHGKNLTYTVKTEDGTTVDTSETISLTGSGVTNYVLTVTDENATHTCYFILTATKTSIPEPEVAEKNGGTPLLVVKSKNSDWSCAIPALEGIKIKYYTSANNSETLDLATLTPKKTGKQNETNNYWEYSNGYKLKVTCGYIHDTKRIYGMPVVVNNNGNKMYFTISSTNGYVSTSTSGRTVTLTYEFTDPNGKTLTFSKTWQFNYADYKNGKQYSYSDFVNGTLKEASSGGCVTPDTLITLADGTQKEIQYVTYEDKLLVWDFCQGEYTSMPSSIVMNHGYDKYQIVTLKFADGTVVNTINGHGFFDKEENKFVILSANNVKEYIGHEFVKQNGNGYTTTKLVGYSIKEEYTESWSVLTAEHYNCILEGMLTLTPAEVEGSPDYLMPFEINDNMKYNKFKMWKDIQKYGLYTYDEFSEYMTEEQFEALGLAEFKVAVGKGYISHDEIMNLISIHITK